jgi:hypothetical protein
MKNKQDDNDNKDDNDDDDIFASGFHSTESSIDSKLLAPFPGKLGCGLNLEAVLSTMQIYDLDNDPEERFLLLEHMCMCVCVHMHIYVCENNIVAYTYI